MIPSDVFTVEGVTYADLAHETGMSVREARSAVRQLVDAQLVEVIRHDDGTTAFRVAVYVEMPPWLAREKGQNP